MNQTKTNPGSIDSSINNVFPSIINIKKLIEMTRWVQDNTEKGCGQLTNLERAEKEIVDLDKFILNHRPIPVIDPVKKAGFESTEELNKMISSVDISSPEKKANFQKWLTSDATKDELLKLPVIDCLSEINDKSSSDILHGHILTDNLIVALKVAIDTQQKKERAMNYTGDSALVAGWKENLKILQTGRLEIW